ncbi:MAG: DNA mismatch repair endonuclease MutL [Prevotella sp.]|nr:DNA mismatch repair endonuclease MutL [Candidatus Prevotella equi]
MDIIQLLPDSVANQIAAGEVIQRPASVIKELVENSIDAGAKNIKVLVCDAGKASIQVIDDGKGMSDTDARLSFERHATSKIRQAQDLFSLHTMGFRGEALASIAAVAQVTLQTRTEDDEIGTRLVIAGSNFQSQEPIACPVGSNFLIENLFYNIPARRKFLKSNATEMSNIVQAFERIVLVYPEVSFSLYNNGMETMNLRASNTHQRIIDIFGKRINQQLLPVDAQTTLCNISGFVGKPESSKKKGCQQYFFVNGRYMKHPYFHKAVMSAFDRLIPDGDQISYFIYLTVNPEDIDVNIHPVKTEIKFDNEQAIWQILMAAVRDAVGKFSEVTSLDFDTEGKPEIPVFNPNGNPFMEQPRIDYDPMYNPFNDNKKETKSTSAPSFATAPSGIHSKTKAAKGWEELFQGNSDISTVQTHKQTSFLDEPSDKLILSSLSRNDTNTEDATFIAPNNNTMDISTEHYQFRGSYIVTQAQSGLMMIDQHRASERILFEKFMKSLQTRSSHTQKVLFPEMVQFPPSYTEELGTILTELTAIGFEITDLGGGSYSVEGIPAGLGGLDAVTLVNDLVTEAVEHGGGATEQVHTIIAQTLAKKAATPYGEILNNDDMTSLLTQLFACQSQRYTPDGRPIIVLLDNDELERRFH